MIPITTSNNTFEVMVSLENHIPTPINTKNNTPAVKTILLNIIMWFKIYYIIHHFIKKSTKNQPMK